MQENIGNDILDFFRVFANPIASRDDKFWEKVTSSETEKLSLVAALLHMGIEFAVVCPEYAKYICDGSTPLEPGEENNYIDLAKEYLKLGN